MLALDRRLKLELDGVNITSDESLLIRRDFDSVLGLTGILEHSTVLPLS